MKLVTAVVKPHTWEDVRAALEAVGITGMTATEVGGRGRRTEPGEPDVALLPRVRVDIVVEPDEVDPVVATILRTARTGRSGDGTVWVTSVDSVVRIRTGDEDGSAL